MFHPLRRLPVRAAVLAVGLLLSILLHWPLTGLLVALLLIREGLDLAFPLAPATAPTSEPPAGRAFVVALAVDAFEDFERARELCDSLPGTGVIELPAAEAEALLDNADAFEAARSGSSWPIVASGAEVAP